MSLLNVNNLVKSFAGDSVLEGVTFSLERGQKMGLIGRNGSGKTTILKIVTGQLTADSGHCSFLKHARWGYLRQEEAVDPDKSVFQEAEDALRPLLEMEARLTEIERTLPTLQDTDEQMEALNEFTHFQEQIDFAGSVNTKKEVGRVLQKLGFKESEFNKQNSLLSGGERTRLALAKILLMSPDILFLDEPTNHLDLNATEWLEEFLSNFSGALLLVSHDRYFLDRVVTSVAELENGKIQVFPGNFSDYWKLKKDQIERQRTLYDRQKEEIERLEEYVRRTMGTQKTGQAKSRLKMIDKIKEGGVERPREEAGPFLSVKEESRSGNEVVIIKNLSKKYGERTLFSEVNLLVWRGERVGIIGPNGAGKSTIIKCLLGRESASGGTAYFGSNVSVGYFAQDVVDLDPEDSVLNHIYSHFDVTPGEARSYLARFLFTGEEVYRTVGLLSGGEKNKLALAQLILRKPNLLILDEPTNHLDLVSCEALSDMLSQYNGTLILISHDRYLLDRVTTRTVEIANGRASIFDGSFAEYRRIKRQPTHGNEVTPVKKIRMPAVTTSVLSPRELSKERKRAVDKVKEAEAFIAKLEDRLQKIEAVLSIPSPGDDVTALSIKHSEIQQHIVKAIEVWESAVSYCESLGSDS